MVRLAVKVLVAVVAATVSVLLALDGRHVITLPRRSAVAAVVLAAVLAAGSTVASAVAEWLRQRSAGRDAEREVVLSATGWAIVDMVGLDYRDLGLAVYAVGREFWRPWRQTLRRTHRVRARRRPAASTVRWAPGKGVIGVCVSRGQVVAQDLHAAYGELGPVSEVQWQGLPDDVRLGLSWAEMEDVRDKYGVVVATPVIDDSGSRGKVVGCVALDGPPGTLDDLGRDDVLGVLDSAGQTLLLRQGL